MRKVICGYGVAAVLLFASTASASAAGERTRTGFWIDLYDGEPVGYEEILKDLERVRIIYLGERHTLERHHELQRRIFRDLVKRGISLVLGLEQMEAFNQPGLDRYCRGEVDFGQLARETEWSKRWGNFQEYRPIIESARQSGAPILALNARRETIRAIARSGMKRLGRKARRELPKKMRLNDPPYERLLKIQLMVHMSATPERLRSMVQAQIARDETMASVLSEFLKSKAGRGRTAVVLCGASHVAYGYGIPSRVRRRLSGVQDRILLFSESGDVELSPEEKAMARDITITHEQLRAFRVPIADYLHATPLKE